MTKLRLTVEFYAASECQPELARETLWTKQMWLQDSRNNKSFTLKTNPLKRADVDKFVRSYNRAHRRERRQARFDEASLPPNPLLDFGERGSRGRWRGYKYEALNALEIVDDLDAALEHFCLIASDIASERERS
ncbi:MAG: hypothetical protein NFCOHLIN_01336 [Gammaproteobacteria bacterium]|nr:hypothetical protein [Gammaproteobacteria bacterium]